MSEEIVKKTEACLLEIHEILNKHELKGFAMVTDGKTYGYRYMNIGIGEAIDRLRDAIDQLTVKFLGKP